MVKPVVLPSRVFPTQKSAEDYFQSVMNTYDIGERIHDPEHRQLLLELNDRHKDGPEKAGVGISHFYVDKTEAGDYPVWADARGIWIGRIDGSKTDWSYLTAIRKPSKQANFKDALRVAVNDLRIKLRDEAFARGPVKCALTDVIIAPRAAADVIYRDPTWAELVEGFVATQGGWDAVESNSGFGGVAIGGRLEEPTLGAWVAYWIAHARPLIVLHDEGGRGPRA